MVSLPLLRSKGPGEKNDADESHLLVGYPAGFGADLSAW